MKPEPTTISTLPARAFMNVGEMNTPSMTGDLTLLELQLAARPFAQLELSFQRFANLDHYNVLPTAFGRGLQMLFS